MEKKEAKQQQQISTAPPSSNLFALECLATTAGKLHESEKLKQSTDEDGEGDVSSNTVSMTTVSGTTTTSACRSAEKEKINNTVPVVQMAPMTSASTDAISPPLPPISLGSFYPPPFSHAPSSASSIRPFADFSFPPPFTHNPFHNFMDMAPSSSAFGGMKMDEMPSWRSNALPPVIPSSRENVGVSGKDGPVLSSAEDTDKSGFDSVRNHHRRNSGSPLSSNNSFDTGHFQSGDSAMSKQQPPQQPPLLFRIDQPPSSNSLLETLVQESQKLLSAQEDNENEAGSTTTGTNKSKTTSRKKSNQACKTNDDFKKAREMVLISPQKKPTRKRNGPNSSVSDVKRAYGGPPFKPGYPPPASNTAESAMCCFHEHTLLKMATRGFWSGDRGPLQDVFRLSRVESSDLQYDMRAVTKHCYNVVKSKLENADGERMMMYKHMRNYVDEFDR